MAHLLLSEGWQGFKVPRQGSRKKNQKAITQIDSHQLTSQIQDNIQLAAVWHKLQGLTGTLRVGAPRFSGIGSGPRFASRIDGPRDRLRGPSGGRRAKLH